MPHQRTQIYLDPRQHAALLDEARRLSLSLAGLMRRLVDEHFTRKRSREPGAESRRAASLSLMDLGGSGSVDVSERPDYHLAESLRADLVKEGRSSYRKRTRRKAR
ncbi:MAG: hypothetical protein HYZ75_14345 [Elusimicrobia bacterium]|nr:hypothetical protein [Elusimicrobiota bacterium]